MHSIDCGLSGRGSRARGGETKLLSQAFDWPEVLWRSIVVMLVVEFSDSGDARVVHGHRGLQRINPRRAAIVAALLFIGAIFFSVSLRPSAEDAVRTSIDQVVQEARRRRLEQRRTPNSPSRLSRPRRHIFAELGGRAAVEDWQPDSANSFYRCRCTTRSSASSRSSEAERDEPVMGPALHGAANRRSLEQIASELGVSSLLVGTFQFVNGRIGVPAESVDPATRRKSGRTRSGEFRRHLRCSGVHSDERSEALAPSSPQRSSKRLNGTDSVSRSLRAFSRGFGQLDATAGGVPHAHELLERSRSARSCVAGTQTPRKRSCTPYRSRTSVLGRVLQRPA